MPLDPAILKARWGVTDAALDPLVEQTAIIAQDICELYCGRKFDLAADAEDFPGVITQCQVRRFPITDITGMWQWLPGEVPGPMTAGSAITIYGLNQKAGQIWPGGTPGGILHIEYTGGYDVWPSDLAWAITQAADILWSDTPGGGVPAGSAGGTGLGAVKKISVVGVYSAELETGSAAASGEREGMPRAWGILPAEITALLDKYRTALVVGIG